VSSSWSTFIQISILSSHEITKQASVLITPQTRRRIPDLRSRQRSAANFMPDPLHWVDHHLAWRREQEPCAPGIETQFASRPGPPLVTSAVLAGSCCRTNVFKLRTPVTKSKCSMNPCRVKLYLPVAKIILNLFDTDFYFNVYIYI